MDQNQKSKKKFIKLRPKSGGAIQLFSEFDEDKMQLYKVILMRLIKFNMMLVLNTGF